MKERRSPAAIALAGAVCRTVLDLSIEPLREAARAHGYALAVHGSVARDIDIVAIPWVEGASDRDALLASLQGVLAGIFGRVWTNARSGDSPWNEDKPHGRAAACVHIWAEHDTYFDISVMPRAPKKETD